jgi:hypothetical protein
VLLARLPSCPLKLCIPFLQRAMRLQREREYYGTMRNRVISQAAIGRVLILLRIDSLLYH